MTTVHYTEPATGLASQVDIDATELADGPPGLEDDELDDYDNLQTDAERIVAWQTYLDAGNRVELAKARVAAGNVATAANRAAGHYQSVDAAREIHQRKRRIISEYVDLPDDKILIIYDAAFPGAPKQVEISRLDFELGTGVVDTKDSRMAHDIYDGLPEPEKVVVYEEFFANGGNLVYVEPALPNPQAPHTFDACGIAFRTADTLASVSGALIFTGIGAILAVTFLGKKRKIDPPSNPAASLVFDSNVQAYRLVATWVAPVATPPQLSAASYDVTLVEEGGAPIPSVNVATAMWSSPDLSLGKKYKVCVRSRSRANDTSIEACTDLIEVPASSPNGSTITPGIPLNVTAELAPLGSGREGIKVRWDAPTSGAPETYKITLAGLKAPQQEKTKPAGLNEVVFDGLSDDSYTASVFAVNGTKSSAGASSQPVVFSNTPTGPPEPPTDLDSVLSVSADGSSTTVVELSWRTPISGPPVEAFVVSMDKNGVEVESHTVVTPSDTFSGVADGTYTFSVAATNSMGTSLPINQTVNVAFANVDPTVINWDMLLKAADKMAWQALERRFTAMQAATFWTEATTAVDTGLNGTVASYANQLGLAVVYRNLIAFPDTEPSSGQVDRMAGIITAAVQPTLATVDSRLWTEAAKLTSNTNAVFSVRYQLAGLMRVLEDLLGLERSIK